MNRTETISELIALMGSIKRTMHGRTYQCSDGATLSTGQLMLLFAIKHHGPISAKELAQRLAMTPGGVSQIVDTLLELGYIIRTPKPTDRRVLELTLSNEGATQVKKIEKERFALISSATRELEDAELLQLVGSLQKVLTALQNEMK